MVEKSLYIDGYIFILSCKFKYATGFLDPQFLPRIVVEKYLDYYSRQLWG